VFPVSQLPAVRTNRFDATTGKTVLYLTINQLQNYNEEQFVNRLGSMSANKTYARRTRWNLLRAQGSLVLTTKKRALLFWGLLKENYDKKIIIYLPDYYRRFLNF